MTVALVLSGPGLSLGLSLLVCDCPWVSISLSLSFLVCLSLSFALSRVGSIIRPVCLPHGSGMITAAPGPGLFGRQEGLWVTHKRRTLGERGAGRGLLEETARALTFRRGRPSHSVRTSNPVRVDVSSLLLSCPDSGRLSRSTRLLNLRGKSVDTRSSVLFTVAGLPDSQRLISLTAPTRKRRSCQFFTSSGAAFSKDEVQQTLIMCMLLPSRMGVRVQPDITRGPFRSGVDAGGGRWVL